MKIDGSSHTREAMDCSERGELGLLPSASNGGSKLTQFMDSLTRRLNRKWRSQGAVGGSAEELEESLDMMRKLRSASAVMGGAGLVKDSKVEEMVPATSLKRLSADGRNECAWPGELPRLSVDSSTDCMELKTAIRDSLCRSSFGSHLSEGWNSPKRSSRIDPKLELKEKILEINCAIANSASYTSSSTISRSVSSSSSSAFVPMNVRSPNLIARLMGLEDVPIQAAKPINRSDDLMKKSLIPPGSALDIEAPKALKLQLAHQTADTERRPSQGIVLSRRFKGLPRSGRVDQGSKKNFIIPSALSPSKQHGKSLSSYDDARLMTIIVNDCVKFPASEKLEETQKVEIVELKKVDVLVDEVHELPVKFGNRGMKSAANIKADPRVGKFMVPDPQKQKFKVYDPQKQRKEVSKAPKKKLDDGQKQTLNAKKNQNVANDVKANKSAAATIEKKPPKNPSKYEPKLPPQKSNSRPKPDSKDSDKHVKGDKKIREGKNIKESPTETCDSRRHKGGNVHKCSRHHTNDTTAKGSSLHCNKPSKQGKKSPKPQKQDDKEEEDQETSSNVISDPFPHSNRPVDIVPDACPNPKSPESEEDPPNVLNSEINIKNETTGPSDDEKRLLSSNQSFLSCAEESFGVDTLRPNYLQTKGTQEHGLKGAELYLDCAKEIVSSKNGTTGPLGDVKMLLSTNQSFLSCAEESFGIVTLCPNYLRTKGTQEHGLRDAELYLDCAKEIVSSKNLLSASFYLLPMLWFSRRRQASFASLDELVEDVCVAFQKLATYNAPDAADTGPDDGLYVRLEKDLMSRDALTSNVWGVGWMEQGDFAVRADLLVGVVEVVLSQLIEAFVTELSC